MNEAQETKDQTNPPGYEATTLPSCWVLRSFPGSAFTLTRETIVLGPVPRPESPAPALLETPVRFDTSFRFANALSNVSVNCVLLDPRAVLVEVKYRECPLLQNLDET